MKEEKKEGRREKAGGERKRRERKVQGNQHTFKTLIIVFSVTVLPVPV